ESNFLLVEELAELLHHGVVHFKLLGHLVVDHVMLAEVEERVLLQQGVLKLVGLRCRNLYVGGDAATAVDRAPAVGHLHFVVRVGTRVTVLAVVVIVVVERDVAIVTLDQSATRSVVLGCGQRQSGVLRQWVNGLHQPLAERSLAGDQAAVMVLNGAGNNLGRRSRAAVDQDNQWIVLAAISVCCLINFLGR